MESSMDLCLEKMESENEQLHVSLEGTQTTCRQLEEKIIWLKAALDQQKTLHRKYVEEVTATEELQIEEFNKAREGYVEEHQSLTKLNHHLRKDVDFYRQENENADSHREKNVFLEKAIEKEKKFHRKYVEDIEANEAIRQRDYIKEKRDYMNEIKALKKVNRQVLTDVAFYKKSSENLEKEQSVSESERDRTASEVRATSYRLPSKVTNEKRLYEDNKKLQSKIVELSSTVSSLKMKNRQLENFKNKIENKKTKYEKDSEVLNWLVDSSKTANKDGYTSDTLKMLLNLAKNQK